MGDELFVKLRYCFMAGYTLPQYCIDNGIKRPLFVSKKKFELFVWEIHYQFFYDKRLSARFCFIDADATSMGSYAEDKFNRALNVKNFSAMNLADFDKIIFITENMPKITSKNYISLNSLIAFCFKRVYVEIPLLHFLQRYPKVKMFLTDFPMISRYKNGKEFNSQLLDGSALKKLLSSKDNSDTVKTTFDKLGYTNSQVLDILRTLDVRKMPDGSTSFIDENNVNPFQKTKNGRRMTAYQPDHFQNRIWFVGTCHQFGENAPWDKTIESYLQKMLNEQNLPYCVENASQQFAGRYQDLFYNLNKIEPAPGDIIFVYIYGVDSNNNNIPFVSVSNVFDPPNDYKEIFVTKGHVNELGYKLIAKKYFKYLTENNFFREVELKYPTPPPHVITDMVYRHSSRRAA